jgi:4-amino-4-deoxy-L-arabinose transferase-like glycosyltransferase
MANKKWLRYMIFACMLLLIAFGLRVFGFADLGTQADEGVYVTAGSRLLAGDLLYRDLFWNHTPGVALLEALSLQIAGPDLLLGRLLSVAAATLSVGFLVLASRQIGLTEIAQGRASGTPLWTDLLAGCLFACTPLAIFWSRFGMIESFETVFAVAGISFILIGIRKRAAKWWLIAGLMAGIALLFKISALVFIGAVGLFVALWWLREKTGEPLRGALLFVGGLTLALLPLLFGLLAQGTLADFARYLSGADRLAPLVDWQGKVAALFQWGTRSPVLPLALLGILPAILARRSAHLLPAIWFAAETVALLLPPRSDFGWKGYSHYTLPMIAAASLVVGVGLGWVWRITATRPKRRAGVVVLIGLVLFATASGWAQDLRYVMRDTEYPMPGFAAEQDIGRALALVTPEQQPILVLGNSVFYHWADRPPAGRYFHYPSFLMTSPLGAEAATELLSALGGSDLGAVLLSNSHRTRLPPAVLDTLYENWVPAATFSYPYQQDAVLLLPRHASVVGGGEPVAFEAGISLQGLGTPVLSTDAILLRLAWSVESPLEENYSAFVHLHGPDGAFVAQHDSWPALGSRPTSTWQPGELIFDYHWVDLPPGSPPGLYKASVGLYRAETMQNLRLLEPTQANVDSVSLRLPLEP